MQNSFQLVTYVSQSSLSKTCCAADDDDMREKQESLQSFPTTNSDLIDWRINGISPSYNFCCGFCGFGLRYDSVGFCQELQPWLMTTSFAQLKDKEKMLLAKKIQQFSLQKMPRFLGFVILVFGLKAAKACFHSISSETERANWLEEEERASVLTPAQTLFYWHSYLVLAASSGKEPLILGH